MSHRHLLPIGIQTFRTIRESNSYYVDKTSWIHLLAKTGSRYFLSRPRRFGKSLLLDTMAELFAGSEELFQGLHIHDRWDWSVSHPVVRISFGGGDYRELEGVNSLRNDLDSQLSELEEQFGINGISEPFSAPRRFSSLLRKLHETTGQRVVALVDEYDKPILDMLEDPEVAKANRDTLRAFYAAIKEADAHVRFAFLTGVSRFSRVSLFSGLNNLEDITLQPEYSSICGYTDRDLEEVFAPELPELDRKKIREWYNGYNWLGEDKVYNPFDVLLLFKKQRFEAHWFETGTPTFLVERLLQHGVTSMDLEQMLATKDVLSSFDVEAIDPVALLFQTGYLTILEELEEEFEYRLGYPNREVKESLNRFWLNYVSGHSQACSNVRSRLRQVLRTQDIAGLREAIHALFSEIPYQWHTKNPISDYEGYYASVFYSHLAALGFNLAAEQSVSQGRVDLVLRTSDCIYLFEFKVIDGEKPVGKALRQVQEKNYADPYRSTGLPVHLVGVEFSRESRNVVGVDHQSLIIPPHTDEA